MPLERRAPQSVHMSGREGERVVERERERERRREGRRREWSGMERSRMAGAVGSSKMTGSAEERRGEERRGGSALNAK